jgi:hypothetical protein
MMPQPVVKSQLSERHILCRTSVSAWSSGLSCGQIRSPSESAKPPPTPLPAQPLHPTRHPLPLSLLAGRVDSDDRKLAAGAAHQQRGALVDLVRQRRPRHRRLDLVLADQEYGHVVDDPVDYRALELVSRHKRFPEP